jgi:exonuclease SbcC
MDDLVRRRGELEQQLVNRWSIGEVQELAVAVGDAERVIRELTATERAAVTGARKAAQELQVARERRDNAWREFDTARDRVAALGPPAVQRADLPASWTMLADWAGARLPQDRAKAVDAAARENQTQQAIQAQTAELRDECAAHGVTVGDQRPRDAVGDALAAARAERERLAGDLERVVKLDLQVVEAGERSAVARALERHLMAAGFERWLLDEALAALVDGANQMLGELSQGQYALAIDDLRRFSVVDHRNADEHRPARTLSGGETFLASLALALSLAEQLTVMSLQSRPRLESIFLDEGFGTLDPQTLDVVAAAIEELGARGRTVGLVTHVRDLAERMPVRFEVREGPGGATVQRVDN